MASARTGHNPAMDFLHNQIERDINAQKVNLENKHTLMGALQAQYKDQAVADSMFRTIRAHTLATQLEQAAAQLRAPWPKPACFSLPDSSSKPTTPRYSKPTFCRPWAVTPGRGSSPATNLALRQRAGLIDPATYKRATEELGKVPTDREASGQSQGQL
jgi:hypothetical protein